LAAEPWAALPWVDLAEQAAVVQWVGDLVVAALLKAAV
jgi:hypothetical protein